MCPFIIQKLQLILLLMCQRCLSRFFSLTPASNHNCAPCSTQHTPLAMPYIVTEAPWPHTMTNHWLSHLWTSGALGLSHSLLVVVVCTMQMVTQHTSGSVSKVSAWHARIHDFSGLSCMQPEILLQSVNTLWLTRLEDSSHFFNVSLLVWHVFPRLTGPH